MDLNLVAAYCDTYKHDPLMFAYYLEKIRFDPGNNPSVLSVGCGRGAAISEFVALSNIYRQKFNLELDYIGVDIKRENLSIPRKALGSAVTLIQANASDLTKFIRKRKFPLVLLRFPAVEANPKIWRSIISDLKDVIAPKGYLFATHAVEVGKYYLLKALMDAGYRISISELNKHHGLDMKKLPRLKNYPGVIDKYVVIASPLR